jgi:hypothetical protein
MSYLEFILYPQYDNITTALPFSRYAMSNMAVAERLH